MFRETLQKALNNTEKSLGVLIMGTDGITVEQVWKNEAKPLNSEIVLA